MKIISTALGWLEANPNFSGWAQALGAFIALYIAIAVPARQRKEQRIATRIADLNLDVALSRGVFFLLSDTAIWLNEIVKKDYMKRHEARTDFIFDDLISRILLWERRETNNYRVIALYLTRGAIIRTQSKLVWPVIQDLPIGIPEITLMLNDLKIVSIQRDFSKRLLDHAEYRLRFAETNFFLRPIVWWIHRKKIQDWIKPPPLINS